MLNHQFPLLNDRAVLPINKLQQIDKISEKSFELSPPRGFTISKSLKQVTKSDPLIADSQLVAY